MRSKAKLGVSLFSYSCAYFLYRKNLREMLESARSCGAQGVEIVAAQMIPGYPYPTREWLEEFRDECLGLGLDPFCYSAHLDSGLRPGRNMTEEEMIRSTINDLECAYRMGASVVRTQQVLSPKLLYAMAPWAEKYEVKIGVEIHPPHRFSTPVWEEYVRVFRDIDSPYVGVCVDLGIYQEYPYDGWISVYQKHGVGDETVSYLLNALGEGKEVEQVMEWLEAQGENQQASLYAREMAEEMFSLYQPYRPDILKDIMPYVTHFHTKFYQMQEGEEKTIPYREILGLIRESGYEGYLISEYEGHYVYKEDEVPCEDQIRAHIQMERRLLEAR